jgi:hypothetical protein
LKRIDKSAFSSSGLKSVRIPPKVEFIGEGCFWHCESLTEIIFENDSNLKRIDKSAFSSSGLKAVRIPPKVEFIGEYCFCECKSLNEVIFERSSSLEEIGRSAFAGSAVESIDIPEKCKVLDGALIGLKSFSVSSMNVFFIAEEDMLMSFDKKRLIQYFGLLSQIVIPSCVEFIAEQCFRRCKSLNELIFENDSNLKRIDKYAFSSSGLKSVQIPAKVESIGEGCFSHCESLNEVIFESDSNLKRIGKGAFSSCGVKSVRIPAKVEFIRELMASRILHKLLN